MLNVSQKDATVLYNASVKLYGQGRFVVRVYNRTFRKTKDGYEPQIKLVRGERCSSGEFRTDSLTRSRNLLIDLSCQNYCYFKSFVTLTFAAAVTDVATANVHFQNYIRSIRRVYPDLKYLGVPEFQKGGRVHYHLLTNIVCGSDLIPSRKKKHTFNDNTGKHVWLEYYDLKYWNKGFSSAFSLDNLVDNFSVTLYILKYLYKSPDIRLFGRNKILKSNNLDRPDILYLSTQSDEYKKVLDYVKSKQYDVYTYESDRDFVPSFVQYSYIK